MKIAICDDVLQECGIIKEFLMIFANEENFFYEIFEYHSTKKLLEDYTSSKIEPDLIFLDIYMDNINGMDAAKVLTQKGYQGSIIFATCSDEHAIDSYKVAADGYLKKPFSYDDFTIAMKRCIRRLNTQRKSITAFSNRTEITVYLKDIIYIDTGDHCCFLHLPDDVVRVNRPIGDMEHELSSEECFLRCHRSFIVNLNKVQSTHTDYFIMQNGEKVLFSVRDKTRVRKYVANYSWKQTRKLSAYTHD